MRLGANGIALCACALVFTGASAGEVREEAAASAVEVPVYVADRDGNPVMDLKSEDFTVYEDGKKQSLLFAQIVVAGAVPAATVVGQTQPAPPSPAIEAPRNFALLFDLTFNDLGGIRRAREAAMRFVTEQAAEDDRIAVFTLSRAGRITMCSNFTTDRRNLKEALATLSARKSAETLSESAGLVQAPPTPSSTSLGLGKGVGAPDTMAEGMQNALAALEIEEQLAVSAFDRASYRAVVRDYLSDLRDFARSLDVLPGRKFVVFFSGGFDTGSAFYNTPDASYEWGGGDSGAPPVVIDSSLGTTETATVDLATTAMANFSTSDCRFYCIDTATFDSGGVESQARHKESLTFFASESGGRYFKAASDVQKPLESIVHETGQYYLLAYTPPPSGGEGAFHRIKVEVSRLGLSISHRRGYYESKPFKKYSRFEKDLQIADIVEKDRHLEGVAFRAQAFANPSNSAKWKEFAEVLVQIDVPGAQFGQSKTPKIEFLAFATTEAGTRVDFFRATPKISEKELAERFVKGGIGYADVLMLRPGGYKIKVIVRNADTGAVGTRDIAISVPEFGTSEPSMATACFLSIGSDWIHVRGIDSSVSTGRLKGSGLSYPLRFDGKDRVAAACPNLENTAARTLLLRLYNVFSNPSTGAPELRVSWSVTDEDDRRVGAPVCKLMQHASPSPGTQELLFSVAPPDLPHGMYSLRITVIDEASGSVLTDAVPFCIGPWD
ncbi:MAG: VWA domain-containing protein [Acidobacteriota bacterium]